MFSRLFRHPSLGHKSWASAYTGFLREAPYHLKRMQCRNQVLLSKNPTMLIPTEETVAEKEMIRHELLGLTVGSAFRGCHGVGFDVKGFRVSDFCLKVFSRPFLTHRGFGAFTSRLLGLRILGFNGFGLHNLHGIKSINARFGCFWPLQTCGRAPQVGLRTPSATAQSSTQRYAQA